MKGFEAIAFYHGWSISAAGISIVFTALVTLSFIISQLHKCLLLWEKKEEYLARIKNRFTSAGKTSPRLALNAHILKKDAGFMESARQFHLLIKSLRDPFSLPKLILLAKKIGLGKPHSTVNNLLSAGLIVPDGKGYYFWDQEIYDNLREKE